MREQGAKGVAGPDVDGAGEHADDERDDQKATGGDGPRERYATRADALRRREGGLDLDRSLRHGCSQPSRRRSAVPTARTKFTSRGPHRDAIESSIRRIDPLRTALMPDQPGRAATVAGV